MRFNLSWALFCRVVVLLGIGVWAAFCFWGRDGSFFSFWAYLCVLTFSFWVGTVLVFHSTQAAIRQALVARYDFLWNAVAVCALLSTVVQSGARLWTLEVAESNIRKSLIEHQILSLEARPVLAINCPQASEKAQRGEGCAAARQLAESINRFRSAQVKSMAAGCGGAVAAICQAESMAARGGALLACGLEHCRLEVTRDSLLNDFYSLSENHELILPSQMRSIRSQVHDDRKERAANYRDLHPWESWRFYFVAFGVAFALGLRMAKAFYEWLDRDKSWALPRCLTGLLGKLCA
ncbi:hypothetical protein [Roseateles sp. BYS87W]|uniref:Uncharacterized protein n=1 Tax=Pelomonas baiyunensis TaxID=3299026 RepID=A0ABW7H2X8_9BURK